MLKIKNVGLTWMAKCNQLTPLPFKGLKTWRKRRCDKPSAGQLVDSVVC